MEPGVINAEEQSQKQESVLYNKANSSIQHRPELPFVAAEYSSADVNENGSIYNVLQGAFGVCFHKQGSARGLVPCWLCPAA